MIEISASLKTYLAEIGQYPVLTKEQEYDLFERLHNGDESVREEIIKCNLRLVVRLSRQFTGKGVSLEDLIQEGNIGLMDVINRFDHNLGFRFSTYGAFWIRQAMQVALRKQSSIIRLPVRKARQLGQMSEVVHEYQCVKGRTPSSDEVAERLHIPAEQVNELMDISRASFSLDATYDNEDGLALMERMADLRIPLPSHESMQKELDRKIHQALDLLTEREHSVLQLRFGLHGKQPRSLRNISRRVGLSQEGVRRVEQRALSKLNRPHIQRELVGLL